MYSNNYDQQIDKNIDNIVQSLNNQLLAMNDIPAFKLNGFHYVKKCHTCYTFNSVLNNFVQSKGLRDNLKRIGFNGKEN